MAPDLAYHDITARKIFLKSLELYINVKYWCIQEIVEMPLSNDV